MSYLIEAAVFAEEAEVTVAAVRAKGNPPDAACRKVYWAVERIPARTAPHQPTGPQPVDVLLAF